MNKILFSIIMPVWNRAVLVNKSIDSVLAQSFKDYELLIIDDGSVDNLEEAIRPYLSEHVIYYKIPHSGVSAARNFGLRHAKGKYIAYLDSDNTWHFDFLSEMYRALNNSVRGKEVAYCKFNVFKKNQKEDTFYLVEVMGKKFDFKKLITDNYIDMNTFVHSKRCVEQLGYFDENLKRLNDWEFIIKITSRFEPLFVNKILVDYYFGIISNAITLTEDNFKSFMLIESRFMKYNDRKVSIWHDVICYKWEGISEKKYLNWLRMTWPHDFVTTNFTAGGFPYMLQIEPTNMCNLSCSVCPAAAGNNNLGRERQHMSFKKFKSIIDDMEAYLLFVVLWDWGEPFMNPELPDMIQYASERDIKVITSTNAHFLQDKAYVKRILTSGLANLIVAIDSLSDENYIKYRKGGNLSKAMAGLKEVLILKKKLKSETLINLRMVIMKSNEHELPRMRKLAQKLRVDKFSVKTANPSLGSSFRDEVIVPDNLDYRRYVYKPETYERVRIDVPCKKVWHMSTIYCNGDVVPCCYDYNSQRKLGNVFEKPFTEIWNGLEYCEIRKKIYYEKNLIPICKDCDINFKLSKNGRFVESRDFNVGVNEQVVNFFKKTAKVVLPKKTIKFLREKFSG